MANGKQSGDDCVVLSDDEGKNEEAERYGHVWEE